MIQERNFYDELKKADFKRITYGIFNTIDDDGYVNFLEKKYKEPFSIEDFEFYDFSLTEKEKFLIKMHNREYLKNIKILKENLSENINNKLYVDYENSLIRIVKLIK